MDGDRNKDDNLLLGRVARGDGQALLLLHERYAGQVYSLARRVLGDGGLAEEVTQDVFLKIWQKSQRYDPHLGRFATWLLSVTRFAAIDRLRREGRRATLGLPQTDEGEYVVPDVAAHDLGGLGQELRLLLQHLPPEQRQVIELAYFAGMTHSEMAEVLQVPLGTVKGRLRLGLEKLRALWLDDPSNAYGTRRH